MEHLKSVNEFESLKNEGTNVFFFTAGWCPDCRFIEPFMPEIVEKYSEYQFIEVNRDEFIDLCRDLDIFGIPSFVVFRNGEELSRFVSKDRKTKEEVENFLDSLN